MSSKAPINKMYYYFYYYYYHQFSGITVTKVSRGKWQTPQVSKENRETMFVKLDAPARFKSIIKNNVKGEEVTARQKIKCRHCWMISLKHQVQSSAGRLRNTTAPHPSFLKKIHAKLHAPYQKPLSI